MSDPLCSCGHPRHEGRCNEVKETWIEKGLVSTQLCPCTAWTKPVENVTSPIDKRDDGKDRWDLLPIGPVRSVVRVLTWSTGQYPEGNWQHVSRPRDRYYAATMRHVTSWFDGEVNDPKSGLPHLAHAVCSLLFLLWFEAREIERLGVKP